MFVNVKVKVKIWWKVEGGKGAGDRERKRGCYIN